MGLFDTIYFKCECGEEMQAQSKSGSCNLDIYDYKNVPPEVAIDANRHAPFVCDKCGSKYEFELPYMPEFIKLKVKKL